MDHLNEILIITYPIASFMLTDSLKHWYANIYNTNKRYKKLRFWSLYGPAVAYVAILAMILIALFPFFQALAMFIAITCAAYVTFITYEWTAAYDWNKPLEVLYLSTLTVACCFAFL